MVAQTEPKAKPEPKKRKPGKLTTGKGGKAERLTCITEEVFNLQEQINHFGSSVEKAENTAELVDLLGVAVSRQCYSIDTTKPSHGKKRRPKGAKPEPQTERANESCSLADMVDWVKQTNPEFAKTAKLQD